MKKRIFAIVLALCMFFSLSMVAFGSYETYTEEFWIYDGQGNPSNWQEYDKMFHPMSTNSKGNGWSWTAATKTLTLNGFEGYFFFGAPRGPMKVTIHLVDGTVNNVTSISTMMSDGGACTLAITGKGEIKGSNISAGNLEIRDAKVTVDYIAACLNMYSGSLTAKACWGGGNDMCTPVADAYSGGTITLDNGDSSAFEIYVGKTGYKSAFANVPATDNKGNALKWGTYEKYGETYAGYLNADGTPATSVRIGKPAGPSFTDIKASDWWTPYIAPAAAAGLVAGNADGSYNPKGELTWAQTLVFATRLDQYNKGKHIYGAEDQTSKWYEIYLDYCLAEGIISAAPANMNGAINRADAAIIFAEVLGDAEKVNDVPADFFSDVQKGDAAYEAVMALTAAGITNGMGDGSFGVDGGFTRAQVAAMVSRIAGLIDPAIIG